jgi:hypothetical protein
MLHDAWPRRPGVEVLDFSSQAVRRGRIIDDANLKTHSELMRCTMLAIVIIADRLRLAQVLTGNDTQTARKELKRIGKRKGDVTAAEIRTLDANMCVTLGFSLDRFLPRTGDEHMSLEDRPVLTLAMDRASTGGSASGLVSHKLRCHKMFDPCHVDSNDSKAII